MTGRLWLCYDNRKVGWDVYAEILWNEETYAAFLAHLQSLADADYKAFQEGLCKTSASPILGVRTPELKRIAKEIARGDAEGFLRVCDSAYYETLLTKAFVIAFVRAPLAEKRGWIDDFVPQIDNWAICDSFSVALKPKKGETETMFDLCTAYLQKPGEYERRFALVLLLAHLITDDYIDRILLLLPTVPDDCYYVHMAIAWCVSVCFVQDREKTLDFLKAGTLSPKTHNQAIQKIVESNRVGKADKDLVRMLKRA